MFHMHWNHVVSNGSFLLLSVSANWHDLPASISSWDMCKILNILCISTSKYTAFSDGLHNVQLLIYCSESSSYKLVDFLMCPIFSHTCIYLGLWMCRQCNIKKKKKQTKKQIFYKSFMLCIDNLIVSKQQTYLNKNNYEAEETGSRNWGAIVYGTEI